MRTLEIIIPKIKNVMLIQLCHKLSIYPSYQVQFSVPLFYTSRIFKKCVQRNNMISVASFIRDYQLTCCYSLGTTSNYWPVQNRNNGVGVISCTLSTKRSLSCLSNGTTIYKIILRQWSSSN